MNRSASLVRSVCLIGGFGACGLLAVAAAFMTHPSRAAARHLARDAVPRTAPASGAVPDSANNPTQNDATRPHYELTLHVNYELLTWEDTARVTVPVANGATLHDAAFFLYANADGVGGATQEHPNVQIDEVTLNGQKLTFTRDGAVIHVPLPQLQHAAFTLQFKTHGIVPRAPAGSGGLSDMLGGSGLEGLLGGQSSSEKKKSIDYGVYSFGDGVLSLGSFWYPSLAVRKAGKWVDEAPDGWGDVSYSEMSDFDVNIVAEQGIQVAATGEDAPTSGPVPAGQSEHALSARDSRDFCVLMSKNWVVNQQTYDVGGKPVRVAAYTLKQDAAQGPHALDIAGHALQIYAKKFGPYLYDSFKVVQGPIRGGAGGMEFSGMTCIAQGLYGDLQKQLSGLSNSLGGGGGTPAQMDALHDLLGEDGDGAAPENGKAENGKNGAGDNPAQDALNGLLSGQKAMLDSLLEDTIAHEAGHQWWAMAVGSDSLRAPWMDEALTNYTAMLYFEDRYGAQRAEAMRALQLKQIYTMARMMGAPDAPANLRTSAYVNDLQYGAVVYGKAALFYDALRHEVGDAAFFGALRDYYRDETDKLADANDLMGHFERRAPSKKASIEALYRRWILETHGDEDIAGGKVGSADSLLDSLLGGGMSADNE